MNDPTEQALELLEKENREFENHWVWKELQCSPDTFFKAVGDHVATLNVAPDQWKEAYETAKRAAEVKSHEKRVNQNQRRLPLLGALRV